MGSRAGVKHTGGIGNLPRAAVVALLGEGEPLKRIGFLTGVPEQAVRRGIRRLGLSRRRVADDQDVVVVMVREERPT